MSLFGELKRRNVFRVAIAYLALAWLVTEVAGTLFPVFGIPDWGVRFVVIVFALGFLPALIISWVYELTPEGIKREKDVVRDASITHLTARRLDVFTIGLIVVALAVILADRLWLSPRPAERSMASADAVSEAVQTSAPEPQYPPNSIAVLPFVNMSDDAANEYFSDGISEEILNALAKVKDLKVTGRTSSFAFKGRSQDLREIGAALSVAHILEGSVRKAENRIRITAQLIKVEDGYHLWSNTYDRELTDIFAVQDEIANAILGELKAELIGGEPVVGTTRLEGADFDLEALDVTSLCAGLEIAAGPFTVRGNVNIDGTAASTLEATAHLLILGSGTELDPAPFNAVTRPTIDPDARIDFLTAETVDLQGEETGDRAGVAAYGVIHLDGGGTYQLTGSTEIAALGVDDGTLVVEDHALTITGPALSVAADGELRVESTTPEDLGDPAELTFAAATRTLVTVNGVVTLLGSRTSVASEAGAPPEDPVRLRGDFVMTAEDGGSVELQRFAVDATGDPDGVIRIATSARLLAGNDTLREGTFTLTTGLAVNLANDSQGFRFSEVRFQGGDHNARHATALDGGQAPSFTVTFANTVAGDPRSAASAGDSFPGDHWGDGFDIDFGVDETLSAASRGTILWTDASTPAILSFSTVDRLDAETATDPDGTESGQPDGAIDRVVVELTELVDVETLDPTGFAIDTAAGTVTGFRVLEQLDGFRHEATKTLTIDFRPAEQAPGTEEKVVTYDPSIGGLQDTGGVAVPTPSGAAQRDLAGPTLRRARYDNRGTVDPDDDRIFLTFSEEVAASDLQGDVDALFEASGFSLASGASLEPLDADDAESNADFVPAVRLDAAVTSLASVDATLQATDGALSDGAHRTPRDTKPVTLETFEGQAFTLAVAISPQTTFAGRDVEITVTALDRQGDPVSAFVPATDTVTGLVGALRFEILDSQGGVSSGLGVRSGNVAGVSRFSNFTPFSNDAKVEVAFDEAATVPVFTASGGVVFDAEGSFRLRLGNTKALDNLRGRSDEAAAAIVVRVTELSTSATGALDPGEAVTWLPDAPERLLTLLGPADDATGDPLRGKADVPGAETLHQGVDSFDVAPALSAVEIAGDQSFEVDAGERFVVARVGRRAAAHPRERFASRRTACCASSARLTANRDATSRKRGNASRRRSGPRLGVRNDGAPRSRASRPSESVSTRNDDAVTSSACAVASAGRTIESARRFSVGNVFDLGRRPGVRVVPACAGRGDATRGSSASGRDSRIAQRFP